MPFHRFHPYNDLPSLTGLGINLETTENLRQLNRASRALSELKGLCNGLSFMPAYSDALVLSECRDNAAIAGFDVSIRDLYEAAIKGPADASPFRAVLGCREAIYTADCKRKIRGNLIRMKDINALPVPPEGNEPFGRDTRENMVMDQRNKQVLYTPPTDQAVVDDKMRLLENFINNSQLCPFDPLFKMAMIHYQYLAIRPLPQGNTRICRILSCLFLEQQGLIALPVLNLSHFLRKNREEYLAGLQAVTHSRNWVEWVGFMLRAVQEGALRTIRILQGMEALMERLKHSIPNTQHSSCRDDVLEELFRMPYFRLHGSGDLALPGDAFGAFLLETLEQDQLIRVVQVGADQYFVNEQLLRILEA